MENLNLPTPQVPVLPTSREMPPSPQKETRKSFFKHWSGVVVLVVLAGLVTWGLLNLPTIIDAVQGKLTAWQLERQIRELEKPYREDKIGGKTPEETFDLFIEALKKEDVELASKYFVLEKQESWARSFVEIRNKGFYEEMVSELEFARENHDKIISDESTTRFVYEIQEGEGAGFGAEIIFAKYPSGVWKIDLL